MSPGPRIAGRPHVEVSRWEFMLGVPKLGCALALAKIICEILGFGRGCTNDKLE